MSDNKEKADSKREGEGKKKKHVSALTAAPTGAVPRPRPPVAEAPLAIPVQTLVTKGQPPPEGAVR